MNIANVLGKKIKIKYKPLKSNDGYLLYDKKLIVIDEKLKDDKEKLIYALMHEMIHVLSRRVGYNQTIDTQIEESLCETVPQMILENFKVDLNEGE